ncbi:MAG: hypothetical protein P4L52_07875 [Acidocella sp.]|nr:hypothetical protein [Acidocella sp.]MDR3719415.1 hypothetical protein [Bryobacteraceae bacterium]
MITSRRQQIIVQRSGALPVFFKKPVRPPACQRAAPQQQAFRLPLARRLLFLACTTAKQMSKGKQSP